MKLFLALSFLAASAVGKLTADADANRYTAYIGATNTLKFAWGSGAVEYRELVGVFTSGNLCTKADTETAGKYPLVEIMPSKDLSNTNNKLLQATSPQVTSAFGSLPITNGIMQYQLCYCNWDPATAKCNYENKVGQLNVIDLVPRHFATTGAKQSKFYLSLTAGPTFQFVADTNTNQRVWAISADKQCGAASSSQSAQWSGAQSTLTDASAAHTLSGPTAGGNTWIQEVAVLNVNPVAANLYKLCFCQTSCGTGGAGALASAGKEADYKYEAGSIFVHDLVFGNLTPIRAVAKAASGTSTVGVTFKYAAPASLQADGVDGRNHFWFSSAVDCGDGSHTEATASSTAVYPMPTSTFPNQAETSVDVTSLQAGSSLYRMCFAKRSQVGQTPTGVYDLSNVGLRVGDLAVSGPQVLKAFNQPVTLTWTSSLSPGDKVFFAKQGTCQAQAAPAAGATHSDTQTVSFSGVYYFDFSAITAAITRELFTLCVLPVNAATASAESNYDSGVVLSPSDVLLYVPKSGATAALGKPNVLSTAAGQTVSFASDLVASWTQNKDLLWFRDASKPCGDMMLGATASDASLPIMLSQAIAPDWSATELTFDFSQVTGVTTNKLFRLCVKDTDTSGSTATEKVYDFASTAVLVTPAYTNAPSAFNYPASPTPAPVYSVTSIPLQVWERGAYEVPTTSNTWPGLTWKFSGTTTTGDLLGFLPVASSVGNSAQDWADCGQPGSSTSSSFWTLASQAGTPAAGQVLSADLPASMPAGRYLVCYCNTGWTGNTAVVPPRDCGLSENWDMTVGFVTINTASVAKNRVAQVPNTAGDATIANSQVLLSLAIPGADATKDKFVLVPAGKPCGTPVDSAGNYLQVTLLSTKVIAASTIVPGLDVSTDALIAGQFDLCYCRAAGEMGGVCPTTDYTYAVSKAGKYAWSYGAKVGSLTVHDMKMVSFAQGSTTVTTSRMSVPKASNVKVKFTYSQGVPSGRPVWFARTDTACVYGSANSNVTNFVTLPASGSEATFNFASLTGPANFPCSEQWRLCTQLADNTVVEYPDVRVVPEDAYVAIKGVQVGAAAAGSTAGHVVLAAKPVVASGLQIASGCQLALGLESFFWFQATNEVCGTANPGTEVADKQSKYLKTVEAGGAWKDGDFAVDFGTPTSRVQFRLCGCQKCGAHGAGVPAATPTRDYDKGYIKKQFWDFPNLQITVVKAANEMLLVGYVNGVDHTADLKPTIKLATATVTIGFGQVAGATALLGLQANDVVWFRNLKNGCGTGADDAAQNGLTTATKEVTYTSAAAFQTTNAKANDATNVLTFDFSGLTTQLETYRACIRTAAHVLDAESAFVLVNSAVLPPSQLPATTKRPTWSTSPTYAAAQHADFNEALLTITPGTKLTKPESRTFEFKPKTKTGGRLVTKGDRLAFVRVADTGLHTSGCKNFKTAAFFETIFPTTQATVAGQELIFKLPRFPVGMYYACYCAWGITCGDGVVNWHAGVGVVQVVDADIDQTITSTTTELFKTTATPVTGNIRLAVNYFSGLPTLKDTRDQVMSTGGSAAFTAEATKNGGGMLAFLKANAVVMFHKTQAAICCKADGTLTDGQPYVVNTLANGAAVKVSFFKNGVTPTPFDNTGGTAKAGGFFTRVEDLMYVTAKDGECGALPISANAASPAWAPSYWDERSLHFTTTTAGDVPTANGKYSVCYCRQSNLKTGVACPDAKSAAVALNDFHGAYGQVAKLIVTDVKFVFGNNHNGWECANTGCGAVPKGVVRTTVTYTAGTFPSTGSNTFWFMDDRLSCQAGENGSPLGLLPSLFPQNTQVVDLAFVSLTVGRRYRLCVKNVYNNVKTFMSFATVAPLVSDLTVTPRAPVVTATPNFNRNPHVAPATKSPTPKSFQDQTFTVQVTSTVSLQVGDVFLFTNKGVDCPSAETFVITTATPFYYNIAITQDRFSSAQQWYGSGSYSVAFLKPTSLSEMYRVCARKSTFDPASGAYTHSVVDLASEGATVVPVEQIALSPVSVENVNTAKVTFVTPVVFNVADQFWFRRADLACNLDTVNTAKSVVADSTFNTASASAKFQLTAVSTSQVKTLDLRPLAVGQKYRLCVQIAASKSIVDIDTSMVEVRAARNPTPPPSAPTIRTNYNIVPTQAGAAVANQNQAFTFNSVSSATSGARTLTWKFPGTVTPQDRLGLLPVGQFYCNGQTHPAFMVQAAAAASSGSATSAEVQPMAAGKYTLCFCHSASSVAGCDHKSGYVQQVGFVTFFDADTNQTASVALSDQTSGFSVTLGHAVGAQDRVMLIAKDGVCGVSQPHAADAALVNVIPAAGAGATTNVLTFGAFAKTVAGTFAICYCRASTQQGGSCRGSTTDPNYLPSFGGKIGDLVIEDVQLNGASFVTATKTSSIVTVKVTQTIFKFNQDKVWLAKGSEPCGTGTHSDSNTLFKAQPLAESMTFNFQGNSRAPSSDLWKLCLQNSETGFITPLTSVGFFYTDVTMEAKYVSPVVGTSTAQPIVLTHAASFSAANTNSYFYFRLASKPCFTTWPAALPTSGSSTDRETSSFEVISASGSAYNFQFTGTQAKGVFRLCASLNGTPNNKFADGAVDLGHIKVYTRPNIMAVGTKALMNTKSSPIKFTSVGSFLTSKDTVWFRRSDKSCESVPPTTTTDKFSLPSYAFVAETTIDASMAEPSDTLFRACVKTEAGEVLDWYNFQTAVVSIASDVTVCIKGLCEVQLTYKGHLKSSDTAWFQASSREVCLEGPSGATASSQLQFSATRALGESGATYNTFDFTSTTSGPSNPLRLCIKKGTDVFDFPTVSLLVNSALLTNHPSSSTAETGVVQATSTSLVNVTYAATDFPSGSSVWFQPKSDACLKQEAGASASASFSPKVGTGAQTWSVDFSKVITAAKGVLTQWTTCMEYQGKVSNLQFVEISLFRFYLDQTSVKNEQSVSLSVLPRTLVNGVPLFQGFYFRVTTAACTPVPYSGALSDNSTTNRMYPSADVHQYDFSKAALGSEYRLCAVEALNAVSDYKDVKVEVSCPDGKAGIGCTQCKTGNYASKASPLTCTSCATPCNGNAVSCSPAANNTVTCQCSGDFDPATACLNCKAGFLKSGALCVATKTPTATPSASPTSPTAAPTAVPTAAPTAAPTAVPTAVPTPARACSQSDAAQYAGKCSNWAKQGYCTKGDYVAFMTQNCAQSCCVAASCQPSIKADTDTRCPGWATAGYCNGEFKDWMERECASSCFSVNVGENPNCHGWAAQGYCVKYSDWMASNNFCQTSCSKDSCTYAEQCPAWARKGFCTTTYADFMSVNCLGSCKA